MGAVNLILHFFGLTLFLDRTLVMDSWRMSIVQRAEKCYKSYSLEKVSMKAVLFKIIFLDPVGKLEDRPIIMNI